jgi:hypothetical protein
MARPCRCRSITKRTTEKDSNAQTARRSRLLGGLGTLFLCQILGPRLAVLEAARAIQGDGGGVLAMVCPSSGLNLVRRYPDDPNSTTPFTKPARMKIRPISGKSATLSAPLRHNSKRTQQSRHR